ncbi:MAG: AraC family transcriptional regulator, partial [Bacteroidota bacterium]
MNFNSELLFFFSALGAFNGIVLGIYIFFAAGKKHIANKFLAVAVLMLSIRAAKSVFFYFDDNLAESFVQVGIFACFFIGPFVYFYVATVCAPGHRPPKWRLHLSVLLPLIVLLTLRYPYYEYRPLWSHYLLSLVYYQWVAYLILSGFIFYRSQKASLLKRNLS